MFGKRGTDESYGFDVRDEETGLGKHKSEVGRGQTGNWPRGLWLAKLTKSCGARKKIRFIKYVVSSCVTNVRIY